MEQANCKLCGKKIEAYTEDHLAQLMLQHNFKHQREEKSAQTIINELKKDERGIKKIIWKRK
tara:strand:+ start:50 stop:235 length:186 start_codon:yes stop_codon:yes gene_type:complete